MPPYLSCTATGLIMEFDFLGASVRRKRVQHLLCALSGDAQGKSFPIDVELVIGRSTSCDVFIPDRRMSRRHARFYAEGPHLFVEDLESHNGTYVNGKRVARMQLFRGDVVRVGTSQFEVSVEDEDSQSLEFTHDRPTAHLVKPISSSSSPSLEQMLADEYFEAIGAGNTDQSSAQDKSHVEFLVQQTRNFAVLFEISKALQVGDEPMLVMKRVLDVVLKVIRADRGFIAVLDSGGHPVPLVVRYREETSEPTLPERVKMSETVAEQVLKDKCGVITSDAATDVRFASAESVVLNDIHSLMAAPIMVGDKVTGMIEVENNSLLSTFAENDLDLLSVVASMVGVALENLNLVKKQEETIAELKLAQEQLLSAQDKLVKSEQMAVIGRLASGIAHEVKNHLSPFILADMIARSYPDDEDIQESAELMLEAQRRILSLVDEIRHFASGNKAEFEFVPHDIVRVMHGVIRFVKCDNRVKATELEFVSGQKPVVDMDANRMRQVFINLIRNAADAVDQRTGKIRIRVQEQGGQVIIEVSDNGEGIPVEVRDRLFEPFFTTKGERGLGLGLDISRNIVIAHGGTLTFDTTLGSGTTFRVVIPSEQPQS